MEIVQLKVSAPGRICLFGEHQDYLGLPVITAAINLRIEIEGKKRDDNVFHFDMPDLNSTDFFQLGGELKYVKERDYLRSAVNVVLRGGAKIPCGYDCTIRGKIPINSGTSSSSALTVAWIKFLLEIAADGRANNPLEIARLAHAAEVLEFHEPGGQMDHYACSVGGVLFIDFRDKVFVEKMKTDIGGFILGNSLESKNTKAVLSRIKDGVRSILSKASPENEELDLRKMTSRNLVTKILGLTPAEIELLVGTLENRDLTSKAFQLFKTDRVDCDQLGRLLNQAQLILRDKLKISTCKIDNMLEAAIFAGAPGGKINGSGGGGCMFVVAPNDEQKIPDIIKAIEKAGGQAYLVGVDQGVRTDFVVYA